MALDEFLVNTSTTGDQKTPAVASLANGGFVVVWTDLSGVHDASGAGVVAQRYDNDGVPVGPEIQVNVVETNAQENPSVTGLTNGDFVVTWEDNRAGNTDIWARLFDVDGENTTGSTEFSVVTIGGTQRSPAVTAQTDGSDGFLIAWYNQPAGDYHGELYPAVSPHLANPATEEFFNGSSGPTSAPAIAGLANGKFVVAWEDDGPTVDAAIHEVDGNSDAEDTSVTVDPGSQTSPSVAVLTNGDFVIAWTESTDVHYELFDSNGSSKFLGIANTATANPVAQPAIAALSNSQFVIAWHDPNPSSSDMRDVTARLFNANGSPQTGEFDVDEDESSASNMMLPALAMLSNGSFVAVWQDDSDTVDNNGLAINAQLFDGNAAAIALPLFGTAGADTGMSALDLSGVSIGVAAGGLGSDSYIVDETGDKITEFSGEGTDSVDSTASYTLPDNVENLALSGSGDIDGTGNTLDNTIEGNSGANTLNGDAGNDILKGDAGADVLNGGAGADNLTGGDGDDDLDGGTEADILDGGLGVDVLNGGAGADNLTGGGGDDILDGGAGTDLAEFSGDSGDYQISIAGSVTTINGSDGVDTAQNIEGLKFDDRTIDLLLKGAGDDTIDMGDSTDGIAAGGAGDDKYEVDDTGDVAVEQAGEGTDIVESTAPSYTLGDNIENLTLDGTGNIDGTGNALDNEILGNSGNNVLDGADGNDTLEGFDGDDDLFGGEGGDTLRGGDGNDQLKGGAGDDILDGDTSTVAPMALPGFSLLAVGDEDVAIYDGIAADYSFNSSGGVVTITDNNPDDGDDGTDILLNIDILRFSDKDSAITVGDAGGTTFDLSGPGGGQVFGGPGGDTYIVDDPLDEPVEAAGEGIDAVLASLSWTLGANLENLFLTGSGNLDGTGNGLDNQLTGTSGKNILIGGEGNDTLIGGDGDDTLDGGFGNLIVAGASPSTGLLSAGPARSSQLITPAADDNLVGTNGIDVAVFTGKSSDYQISISNNVIVVTDLNPADGDDGTDTLRSIEIMRFTDRDITVTQGTPNDDSLDLTGADGATGAGGDGNDTYFVDDLNDLVLELFDEGIDTILSSVTLVLGDNIENLILVGIGPINATGNDINNELAGNANNNVLSGLGGMDNLDGGRGDDILDGGAGADTLAGGPGNDTYFVDNIGDIVTESSPSDLALASARVARPRLGYEPNPDIDADDIGDNVDEVIATISYTLTDFVENLTLDGAEDIDGTGNDLDNTVIGNSGDNTLTTGSGEIDVLSGGDGADTFIVDKTIGRTNIEDTPGDGDVLDLSSFVGDGELSFKDAAGGSLRVENGLGGVVELVGFYIGSRSIQFIDIGNGPRDVSSANFADEVAQDVLVGGILIDDDGNLFDAEVLTDDGDLIPAAELQVFRTFLGGLGRNPDQGGFDFWLGEITSGARGLTELADGFVSSAEFLSLTDVNDDGVTSTTEFLNHLFENVFGRAPDEGGFTFWSGELDSGRSTQADVLVGFTQSNEYVEQTINPAIDYLVG